MPALASARPAALVFGLLLTACNGSRGQVEINWSVVDAAGRQGFPEGDLDDLCRFTGRTAEGGERRPYSLHVRLRLCEPDCPGECVSTPECQVETIDYRCESARGFSTVPARDEEYDFEVDLMAQFASRPSGSEAGGECACELGPSCALVPGPRTRAIEPGLVTDLQVYLLVLTRLDLGSKPPDPVVMDLDGCCDPGPNCS
jgi:hypothetical protein